MREFIWKRKRVAWIENGDVFAVATGKKIATVRDHAVYSLQGAFVGYLVPRGSDGGFSAAFAALLP